MNDILESMGRGTLSRRALLLGSLGMGVTMAAPRPVFAATPRLKKGDRVRLAAVGIWGKGFSDWLPMVDSGEAELVALCDADSNALNCVAQELKRRGRSTDVLNVPFFTDYRDLLDNAARLNVEALTVSTPDHMHAPIAISAMRAGLHCYVQKPLVHSLGELTPFYKTARRARVITQMGNQASALDGFRRAVEILRSGLIGEVRDVYLWTDRPVWPQGVKAAAATLGPADPIPGHVDWNAWLGVARYRPFKGGYKEGMKGHDPWNLCGNVYHPFSWRGFVDFGCGALGDMACHMFNMPYRGLEMGELSSVECVEAEDVSDLVYPSRSVVVFNYAARRSKVRPVVLPPLAIHWYEGGKRPTDDQFPLLAAYSGGHLPPMGTAIIGSKGFLCTKDGCDDSALIALTGETVLKTIHEHEACKSIPMSIPRCGGGASASDGGLETAAGAPATRADGHYVEFLHAIRGEGPFYKEVRSRCYSDVEYSVPMMEGILAGCIAQQVPGKLAWDASQRRFASSKMANDLVSIAPRTQFEY